MVFKVKITQSAEAEIETAYTWLRERNPPFADQWFRGLMNASASLQEKPRRCPFAPENEVFNEEIRQLLYGKSRSVYRIIFIIRGNTVYVLHVLHSAQTPLTTDDTSEIDEE